MRKTNVTLHDEDARALDLLLDRTRAAAGGGGTFAPAAVGRERLAGVEKVLGLLQMLPPVDPPQDLVARTLRFVGQSADGSAVRGAVPMMMDSPHPHA